MADGDFKRRFQPSISNSPMCWKLRWHARKGRKKRAQGAAVAEASSVRAGEEAALASAIPAATRALAASPAADAAEAHCGSFLFATWERAAQALRVESFSTAAGESERYPTPTAAERPQKRANKWRAGGSSEEKPKPEVTPGGAKSDERPTSVRQLWVSALDEANERLACRALHQGCL